MYESLLKEIEARGSLPSPATDAQIEQSQSAAREKFGAEIPEKYLEFLQKYHNGFNWNGLYVYAAGEGNQPNDFVFENTGLRTDDERFNDFLVFAEDDMSFYVYCLSADEYQVLDKIPLDVMDSFSSFDELMQEAFASRLPELAA